MSTMKFKAILPQTVQIGDKILIKGKINNEAEEFSINFVNDCLAEDITYHFKWIIPNIIVENYKENGEWSDDHRENEYNNFDGSEFALEFAFLKNCISVFLVHKDGTVSLVTDYYRNMDFSKIESVQVCDDVDKVKELTFVYA